MLTKIFSDNLSFISFLFLLLFMGLFYQVAWQYPAIDGFPLIERLLNEKFLVNDFFTNTFKEFSPRLASAKAIVWLSKAFDSDYQVIVAYCNIIRIWLYGIGLYLLFFNLAGKSIALIAFSFSALSFLSMPFLPAWWPITYDLTSSNIALVFAMFAWVCALRSQVQLTFLVLTAAVFVHPVVGVQALIISIILYLVRNSWGDLFNLFKQPSIYPCALAFLVAFLFNYISYQQILPDQEFIAINGQFRHGHHFNFSHMDVEKWLSTILMVLACLVITKHLKHADSKDLETTTYVIIAYSVSMVAISYLFTQLYPTRFMISFIPMRGFPILVPIVVLAFARLAYQQWQQHKYCNFLLLFLPFLPYQKVGLTWFLFPHHHELVLPLLLTGLVLILLIMEHYSVFSFRTIDSLFDKVINKASVAIVIFPISIAALLLALTRFDINIPNFENHPKLYQWLYSNTAQDDVILSELNAANNQKLRLLSRRAVVVSKDFPFNELFYRQWYQRYSDVYQHRDSARGRIDQLSEDELNLIMDNYGATILLRTRPLQTMSQFSLLGESIGEKGKTYIYRNNEHHKYEITADE